MHTLPVMGVDIGGSHITTSLVNITEGLPIAGSGTRLELNSRGTADEILSTCSAAIRQSYPSVSGSNIAIGIAMPGPFDYANGICLILDQDKFRALYRLDMKKELAARLSIEPDQISFMNDACAFLEGEVLGGAVRGRQHVMGITLGTGLGSAFSQEHDIVDADLWCAPFRDGIAEDYLSTRWFITRYEQLTLEKISGVKELSALKGKRPEVETVFNEFAENLGAFIGAQYRQQGFVDVVIGGNIAKASAWFAKQLDSFIAENAAGAVYCFSTLGENAVLTGAAGMASRRSANIEKQLHERS